MQRNCGRDSDTGADAGVFVMRTDDLTKDEQAIILDLDRLVDHFSTFGMNDRPLTVSGKQFKVIQRILKKAVDHPTFDFAKKFDLTNNKYRGHPITVVYDGRKRYRKSNLVDWIEQ